MATALPAHTWSYTRGRQTLIIIASNSLSIIKSTPI